LAIGGACSHASSLTFGRAVAFDLLVLTAAALAVGTRGDADAVARLQSHGAREESAVGGRPRGRADGDGGRDARAGGLDRHARRGRRPRD